MSEEKVQGVQNGTQVRATVADKAPKPAGLLPKNTQQLVILGVAVVMVLIMWLTGSGKRRTAAATSAPQASRVAPPNPASVEDFKQSIQKEQAATRQPISPAALARLQAVGLAGDVPANAAVATPDGTVPQPGTVVGGGPESQAPPPPDPVQEDRKKRQYLSLFAPNVAFTYRQGESGEALTRARTVTGLARPDTAQDPPTDTENLVRQTQAQLPASLQTETRPSAPSEQQNAGASAASSSPIVTRAGAFNLFAGKRYVVFEGTVIEALLVNRLNGTFAGPVSCLVTTDTYSHDRQQVLIPAGTKVVGEAKKAEALGQQRLAVFFHRLIMPDGFSVSLDQFKGLNQAGETALRDKVNNHYLQIFGASLAVGILGGISEAGTGSVLTNSPLDRARAGLGSSLANSSTEILDRFLNILPTVTIREGSRVKVYLSGDLVLPAYAQHTMSSDL